MKKKVLATGIIAVVAAVSLCLYFKPLAFSGFIEENEKILITAVEFEVEDGVPSLNSENFNEINDAQKSEIISLMEDYTYHRTFGTLFSDGSLTDLGDELLQIYFFDGSDLTNTVCISSTGNISVNDRTYKMGNTSELIHRVLETVTK